MQTTCKICGKEFRTYPSTKKQFCSYRCACVAKTKEKASCKVCGTPVARVNLKFCSIACSSKDRVGKQRPTTYKRVTKSCLVCGKKFWIHRWEAEAAKDPNRPRSQSRKKGLFCSIECNAFDKRKSFKDHFDVISSANWRDLRQQILKRDEHRCQLCGLEEIKKARKNGVVHSNIEINHIIPKEKVPNHEPSNLIALCGRCHYAVTVLNEVGYKNIPSFDPRTLIQQFKKP